MPSIALDAPPASARPGVRLRHVQPFLPNQNLPLIAPDAAGRFNSAKSIAQAHAWLRLAADQAVTGNILWDLLSVQGEVQTMRTWLRIGSCLRVREAMALTGWSRSALHKAKKTNRVLAFRLPGQNFDYFPMLQFDGHSVRKWVPALLQHVGNAIGGLHFLTVARTSLEGASYAEALPARDFAQELIDGMLDRAERLGDPAR